VSGKLVVYSSAGSFAAGRRLVDFQRALGSEQEVLGPDACMALEPALACSAAGLGRRIVGAVFTPSEEVGDCYAFCAGLEKALHGMGVGFRYGFRVRSLEKRRSGGGLEVACALDGADAVEADRFVLASGAASARLADPLGIRLPIYPLQGYSISIPAQGDLPTLSVTDFDRKVVYAHLCAKDDRALPMIRVAGLVDLAGHDASVDATRLKVLLSEVARAFPAAANGLLDVDNIRPWAGLRPATPRGTPLLGATRARNLYLNTGHGALGWTLAHASAKIVSDVIVGRQPELPVGPFQIQ
jgi:D-amino-acid dehydrogenase